MPVFLVSSISFHPHLLGRLSSRVIQILVDGKCFLKSNGVALILDFDACMCLGAYVDTCMSYIVWGIRYGQYVFIILRNLLLQVYSLDFSCSFVSSS